MALWVLGSSGYKRKRKGGYSPTGSKAKFSSNCNTEQTAIKTQSPNSEENTAQVQFA